MLQFNWGNIIFQLVSFLVLLFILVFVIIGITSLIRRSSSMKTLENQNKEILSRLSEIEKKIKNE